LGFAKKTHHNWELLGRLRELHSLGVPLLIGASRKSFLRALCSSPGHEPTVDDLDTATATVSTLAARSGASCVRVHNVRKTLIALRVDQAWSATSAPLISGPDRSSDIDAVDAVLGRAAAAHNDQPPAPSSGRLTSTACR
jgi:dihydropteroate synthase